MKKSIIPIMILVLLAGSVPVTKGFPQSAGDPDRTGSPYFFVQSDDPANEQLPLLSTEADVNIAGVIANVTVTQVYKNNGTGPIEAIYVFPASTLAAVHGMTMTIGERVVIARIDEKNKARQAYEDARDNGQSASLLEQQRPNVFQMNVANIMPGDTIEVELQYTELLRPVGNIYEFTYPAVVGPRYVSPGDDLASASEGWTANPYLEEGQQAPYSFSMDVTLSAGMPLRKLVCPSHKTDISFKGEESARISLKPEERNGGNRDFVIRYKLAGDRIHSGVLLYEGNEENYFLAMVQPPERIAPDMVPPREYVFIVDVSGSMNGFPLDVSKKLLKDLIGNLRPVDRFNVVLFAASSRVLSDRSLPASGENIREAISFIEKERGGGGTELISALKRAFSIPKEENVSRSFIIATDGYISVEQKAFEIVRNNLDEANFFAFGIGSGVNRHLIEGLAHAGQGEPFIVLDENEAPASAEKFRKYVSSPVLTGIDIEFSGTDVYDVIPESYPDLFAQKPLILFGKYNGRIEGVLSVSGTNGEGLFLSKMDLDKLGHSASNSAIRMLWAREKIRWYDDLASAGYGYEDFDAELVELGLEYNLLTRLTSFVAIDSEIRNTEGDYVSVKQPLPLPQGVSNYAVGGAACSKSPNGGGNRSFKLTETAVDMDIRPKENEIFTVVEKSAEFRGGSQALDEFIKDRLSYPEDAKKAGVNGTVFVEFIVGKDGTVKDVKVVRGVHPSLDKEAMRVLKLTDGMWKPAEQRGKAVESRFVVPVRFKI